jgi:hypothetical protein
MFSKLNNNWFCPNKRTGSAPGRRSDVFFRGTKVDRILWKFKTEFCAFATHSWGQQFVFRFSMWSVFSVLSYSDIFLRIFYLRGNTTYYCQPDNFRVMWTWEHGSKMIPQISIAWLGDYDISIRTSLLQKKTDRYQNRDWSEVEKRTSNLPKSTKEKRKKVLNEKHLDEKDSPLPEKKPWFLWAEGFFLLDF